MDPQKENESVDDEGSPESPAAGENGALSNENLVEKAPGTGKLSGSNQLEYITPPSLTSPPTPLPNRLIEVVLKGNKINFDYFKYF